MVKAENLEGMRRDFERLSDAGQTLRSASPVEEFATFEKRVAEVLFHFSDGSLAASGGRKLKELAQILSDLEHKLSRLIRLSEAETIFERELRTPSLISARQGAGAVGRHLSQELKSQKRSVLELQRSGLSRMDFKKYDRILQRMATEETQDADRAKALLRKKYLKSLLPLQLFNAEGQQSRSPRMFSSLHRSLMEIMMTAERFSQGEDEDLNTLKELGKVLKRIAALDLLTETILHLLRQERNSVVEALDRVFSLEDRNWSQLLSAIPRISPGKWQAGLVAVEGLRDSAVAEFLRIWEEIEYQKTWFKLFNQSFN